eukprot:1169904-Amorphochlora_amoeboformis.AAC.2
MFSQGYLQKEAFRRESKVTGHPPCLLRLRPAAFLSLALRHATLAARSLVDSTHASKHVSHAFDLCPESPLSIPPSDREGRRYSSDQQTRHKHHVAHDDVASQPKLLRFPAPLSCPPTPNIGILLSKSIPSLCIASLTSKSAPNHDLGGLESVYCRIRSPVYTCCAGANVER